MPETEPPVQTEFTAAADKPSSASLIAAMLKTKSANGNMSLRRKITKRGVSKILITVKILGIFIFNDLFSKFKT